MSWAAHLAAELDARRAREVQCFSAIDVVTAYHNRLAATVEELRTTKRERDRLGETVNTQEKEAAELRLAARGLTLHSAKEKELEERLAATEKQLREALERSNRLYDVENSLREAKLQIDELQAAKQTAAATITQLTSNLADQSNTNSVLKREYEALRTENEMQRAQFAHEKSENEKLIPAVLNAKRVEAELRNEIMELEQRLLHGGAGSTSKHATAPRDALLVDPSAVPQASCVAPSYIAHSTEDAHGSDVHSVTVTDNGKQIWTGGAEKIVKGWDSNNGSSVGRFATAASTVCLDSKSSYLVAGCVDFACRVWHLPTMRLQCQLTGHTEGVTSSYLSPDATHVYTASRDCTIRTWDLSRGALQHTALCASSCYDLAAGVDRICTAHFDNAIRLWDVRTGKVAGEVRDLHDKAVTSVRLFPDGMQCATLSRDNTIKLVDLRMLQATQTFSDPKFAISSNLSRITVSPDGAFCAAGTSTGSIAVFNTRNSTQPPKFLMKGHTGSVTCVCWSPDGRGIASVGTDRRLILWR